ncbi:MAG: DegT/DnrJ/EryC1/StrS family aminotransferase, partial [Candidatus Omnitrophica bacterium]|nr:DegT/DnrJ/EryC1/StrS family aminotransferase [Candidatus Omnitrophota bacterium]
IIISFLFESKPKRSKYIEKFENMFCDHVGTLHAISMPSARLGLYVLLKYYNFPKGSEVIITPFTHQSIFTVLKSFNLKPVFVDIDVLTHNTNPDLVRKAVTDNTKLLILTHMWGQPCNMKEYLKIKQEHDIAIIEDCAMAAGASFQGKKVGSFGDASIFSFGKAKAICAFGGGMLCTSDSNIFRYAKDITKDFRPPKPLPLSISIINSFIANILTRPFFFFFSIFPIMRLFNLTDPYNPVEHKKDSEIILAEMPDEWKTSISQIQAAVGIEQLKSLDKRNDMRIKNSELLNELLKDIDGILTPVTTNELKHIYLYHALYIKNASNLNALRKKLLRLSVDTQLNELTTPTQLGVFGANSEDFPVFNDVSDKILVIPNGIYLNDKDINKIATALKICLNSQTINNEH